MALISGVSSTSNTYIGILIVPTTNLPPISTNIYYSTTLDSYSPLGPYIESETKIKFLYSLSQHIYLASLDLNAGTFNLKKVFTTVALPTSGN